MSQKVSNIRIYLQLCFEINLQPTTKHQTQPGPCSAPLSHFLSSLPLGSERCSTLASASAPLGFTWTPLGASSSGGHHHPLLSGPPMLLEQSGRGEGRRAGSVQRAACGRRAGQNISPFSNGNVFSNKNTGTQRALSLPAQQ